MNKLKDLKTKIFLDSSDPLETKKIIDSLGFLDGQTTNPSLLATSPQMEALIEKTGRLSEASLLDFYKEKVQEISKLIPKGSVSIEVYPDENTTTATILEQAEKMYSWIPNAHIKFPTIPSGLKAANKFISAGGRANMTLVFNYNQALAVHKATLAAKPGSVYLSPFIGRLNNKNKDGIDFVKQVLKMYKGLQSKVEVLASSVRTIDQFMQVLDMECDIVTAPSQVLEEWSESGMVIDTEKFPYEKGSLKNMKNTSSNSLRWEEIDIAHPQTSDGLAKFVADWKGLLSE